MGIVLDCHHHDITHIVARREGDRLTRKEVRRARYRRQYARRGRK